ncbi:ATP-binding protein [Sedimentitalea nanhaiensis]|uniref:ATPase family associated with various cellular activities (AAA) n=1 Tax=Sedimentitalea nanhaiensis TaxID=999627 RepID=A0A1I7BHX6_9RHOB|nr:ATP-binding protein [Sedimentitalea nanhaiensis]SFT86757.1 ATPase family associated with various cellular activities (AAA) [Sedimentitalea nanhaiensis]
MTVAPKDTDLILPLLDAEWARIDLMLVLAEAMRTGVDLPESFSDEFDSQAKSVETARAAGSWTGLTTIAPRDALDELKQIDLDLLALAVAPVARPALGPRIHSLQPQIGGAFPGLPLVQEMLMLKAAGDVDLLFQRLSPTAPMVAAGLLRVEGSTPYQVLRPGARVIRAILNRDAELAPPPGANLSNQRGKWTELILPPQALSQLRDFTAWVHHNDRIGSEWGGKTMHGPLALFSGASGTGKTFAASVVATALSERTSEPWALYTLDLGRIMSKYVGETEANLNALLESLDGRRAILQIDEADGLLGKRGEVSDARDRYANLEVSHMLSRFERHNGPVILTTNLRSNVDSAFLRRFQLIVDFPAPDAAARAELWRILIPANAPRADRLDVLAVGDAVRLSGGSIANAAHYAAVLAAEDETPIDLPHIARAVRAELMKDGRQVRKSEIGFLCDHLSEDWT